MQNFLILVGLFAMGLGVAACCEGETAATAKAEQVVCTAACRSRVEVGIKHEKTLTFDDSDVEQSVTFTGLAFRASYRTGTADSERGFQVWDTDAVDKTCCREMSGNMRRGSYGQSVESFLPVSLVNHPWRVVTETTDWHHLNLVHADAAQAANGAFELF